MTNEENYRFDISGYLVVRGVLSAAEVDTYNNAFDQVQDGTGDLPETARDCYPLPQLRDHPVLARYVVALCGEDYRPDTGPV
ncbi:MAG: hypothetical protein GKR89_29440 [Candidatus Latescibacteria bacterium]|nr:hypothetical protein [Candidatus Latescibacterota bacterium]